MYKLQREALTLQDANWNSENLFCLFWSVSFDVIVKIKSRQVVTEVSSKVSLSVANLMKLIQGPTSFC